MGVAGKFGIGRSVRLSLALVVISVLSSLMLINARECSQILPNTPNSRYSGWPQCYRRPVSLPVSRAGSPSSPSSSPKACSPWPRRWSSAKQQAAKRWPSGGCCSDVSRHSLRLCEEEELQLRNEVSEIMNRMDGLVRTVGNGERKDTYCEANADARDITWRRLVNWPDCRWQWWAN